MLKKLVSILFILVATGIHAQFTTNGDANETTCNCFELTDDVASENGSFHQDASIDLNTAFHFKFTVNFGCEETGGEGVAFVLQSGPWVSGDGAFGLGYENIIGNSLAVEFDTKDSDVETSNFDIIADHISLQDNGDIDHEDINPNNLLGDPSGLNAGEEATPHYIKPGFPNMEDCEDHLVEIIWTPGANQTIEIKVDNSTTLTYIGNMIADQFDGNPTVLWGWTGSTGIVSNTQTVCMALVPNFSYSATNCPGELINFTDESCTFFPITTWDWDFDGLGGAATEDPDFIFDDAGEYDIELIITDSEGCESTLTVTLPIGFETETSADDLTICPDGSTIIHAMGSPFEETECCFNLVLNDLWGDYWGSGTANEIEIVADGDTYGFYTPTSFDPGSGTSDTVILCFDQGTELEFIIHGEDSPSECSYFFLTDDLTEIFSVDGADPGVWVEGATETHTVDCGLIDPEYEYLWDNAPLLSDETDPDPTATISTDTWFHVEITDPATGCTILDSILITVHPPIDAVISGVDEICDGDLGELTVTFTGPAPYDINITGPDGPLPPITDIMSSPYTLEVGADGDYIITYVTGDGCEGTFSGVGTINVITPFSVEIEASAEYCDGDPIADITVTSTDGGDINWYDNPGLIPPVIGTGLSFTPPPIVGTYTYYAAETEGVLGCEGPADEVTITIYPIPPAPAFTGDIEYCEGEDATALFGEPSLGGTLTWYDDPPATGDIIGTDLDFTPPVVPPGTTIYVTETADGCEGPPTEIMITVNPTPEAPVVTGETNYCEGDIATALSAVIGSGGTIEWRSESDLLLEEGETYTPELVVGETILYVYEVLGDCVSEPTEIVISVQAFPTINLPEEAYICFGDSIQITAENNGYDITWSDGQIGETVWFKPEVTTSYIGTATNPACGSSTDAITIIVYDRPDITTCNDTTVGVGGEVRLWAFSEESSIFTWRPDIYECITSNCSEVFAIPDRATAYVVSVTDENGCTNTDTIFVDMDGLMELYVPNIFSPNGDGSNDYLVIYGPRLFNFKLQIYDRWGKRIFQTEDQKDYWDGTFNGEILATQTFVYIITGENIFGEPFKKEGNVTIMK